MLRKFRKQETPEEPEETIDIVLLEKHLESIKVCLLEVRGFRKKKIVKSPTFHFIQKIDIEEAWLSCRDILFTAYGLLCNLAQNLGVEYEEMQPAIPFGKAIDQFVNLIDLITIFLETTDASKFSAANLKSIDTAILKIQQSVVFLQRRVMVDFVFTRNLDK